MTDEQCIGIMAAIIFNHGDRTAFNAAEGARNVFEETRKLGPLPSPTLPNEPRKTVFSRSTVAQQNERHAERVMGKPSAERS